MLILKYTPMFFEAYAFLIKIIMNINLLGKMYLLVHKSFHSLNNSFDALFAMFDKVSILSSLVYHLLVSNAHHQKCHSNFYFHLGAKKDVL